MPSINAISYSQSTGESNSTNRIRSALDGWSERVHNAVRRWRWPSRERNLIAAFFTLLSLTVLSIALADEEWIYVEGGKCTLRHIGVSLFYGFGSVSRKTVQDRGTDSGQSHDLSRVQTIYTVDGKKYYDCINSVVADIFHGLMGVLLVAVVTSFGAFFLDTFGVRGGFLAWLRRNSIFSIFTVIFCVIILGLTYWASDEIEQIQRDSVQNPESVYVSFEDGFYLVVAGAAFSICTVIANLVRSSLQIKRRYDDRLLLLENAESNEAAINAATSRENFLRYYHDRRRRSTGSPNSQSDAVFGCPPAALNSAVFAAQRPVGSTGPPPPLQMILNVPPPPPYSP